ncbi:MAG TPA: dienelactone hydrolase family protein [Jatrophihabitantaceae bacterium]|jgi:carboxymethylenebutenolidase|nr:dienelactone hydrolase family protein [Jatrophihabitantaceae bacterium]
MDDDLTATTVTLADGVPAYLATPTRPHPVPGVVVIHHMPGWDRATKEIVRRFATLGYAAISPNLHHRDAPGAAPDDASAAARAAGGVPDDRLVGEVDTALGYLRAQPNSTGRVGVIGYCSGGRQAVLCACRLPFDAAVDCYGAFVLAPSPSEVNLSVRPLDDDLPNLTCPLLGLFGADDRNPAPAEVAELERRLTGLGKDVTFHSYEDAGHAFFAVDRPAYRVAAAEDGWRRIANFFGTHLGS